MLETGHEHLESLRDSRIVCIGNKRVDDVTTHPAFRHAARTVADIYDMVFVHNDARLTREIYIRTPAHCFGNHQSNLRFWSKLRLLVGLASRVTQAMGHRPGDRGARHPRQTGGVRSDAWRHDL
ncbi:hypothetical protein NKDENANG_02745 [Candidatus Entotheonellaceae bacterium PAL068K]